MEKTIEQQLADALEANKVLEQQLADANKEIGVLKANLEASEDGNLTLLEQLEAKDTEIKVLTVKAAGTKEVITAEHEGKVYQILGGAYVPVDGVHQKLSAADIAASPEVLAHLVGLESGILKEVK